MGLAVAVFASLGTVYWLATHLLISDAMGYITAEHAVQAVGIKSQLADYYAKNGSWSGVGKVFPSHGQSRGAMKGSGGVFLLTDPAGNVIYATSSGVRPAKISPRLRAKGIPIIVAGKTVGILFTGPLLGQFTDVEARLLTSIRRTVGYAAAISVGIALLIGIVLVRIITAPFVRLTAATRAIAAGDLSKSVAVSGDDEIGRLGAVLDELRTGLARSEGVRRRMLADIAHELRNPLAIVRAKIEAMLDGVQPADEENLVKVNERLDHLAGLIDELQDIALAEAHELPLHRKPVDLEAFLRGVAADARTFLSSEGKEFQLDVPSEIPAVTADPRRLHQIVWNLISNALRHTHPGDVVTLRAVSRDGDVLFQVIDTGEGMPADAVAHVFDRFYKGKRSTGLGLGLAITKALVEAHGGQIGVDSRPNGGTRFWFTIPVSSPDTRS